MQLESKVDAGFFSVEEGIRLLAVALEQGQRYCEGRKDLGTGSIHKEYRLPNN